MSGVATDRTDDDPCACAAGHLADDCSELRVIREKGRGRFRPDDEIDLGARIVRGGVDGQISQLAQRLLELGGSPIGSNRDILLHQQRGLVGLGGWRFDQPAGLQHCGGRERGGKHHAALRPRDEKCGGHRDVDQHDFERNSVHTSEAGNAAQRDVIDLRDAEQVPGKSGDAGSRQFDRDPQEWSQHQGSAMVVRTGEQTHNKPEDSVIQAEITTKEKQRPAAPWACSGRRTGASCRKSSNRFPRTRRCRRRSPAKNPCHGVAGCRRTEPATSNSPAGRARSKATSNGAIANQESM